ncbi:MAG: hypothetical protein IPK59_10410 [Rhodospirillaceae bacterium]|nr:hypothetical protein [Rhodospirillaceae bacterium]
MTAPALPPSSIPTSDSRLIFVRHPLPGDFIELVSVYEGEQRSLVLAEKRALGLIQQLGPFAESTRRFPIYDHDGTPMGDIGGDHALAIISNLARAVHANRRFERTRRP